MPYAERIAEGYEENTKLKGDKSKAGTSEVGTPQNSLYQRSGSQGDGNAHLMETKRC